MSLVEQLKSKTRSGMNYIQYIVGRAYFVTSEAGRKIIYGMAP